MELALRRTFRKMVLEYGITDLVGFSKTFNDELDNLIRLAYGLSMILELPKSRGIEI